MISTEELVSAYNDGRKVVCARQGINQGKALTYEPRKADDMEPWLLEGSLSRYSSGEVRLDSTEPAAVATTKRSSKPARKPKATAPKPATETSEEKPKKATKAKPKDSSQKATESPVSAPKGVSGKSLLETLLDARSVDYRAVETIVSGVRVVLFEIDGKTLNVRDVVATYLDGNR